MSIFLKCAIQAVIRSFDAAMRVEVPKGFTPMTFKLDISKQKTLGRQAEGFTVGEISLATEDSQTAFQLRTLLGFGKHTFKQYPLTGAKLIFFVGSQTGTLHGMYIGLSDPGSPVPNLFISLNSDLALFEDYVMLKSIHDRRYGLGDESILGPHHIIHLTGIKAGINVQDNTFIIMEDKDAAMMNSDKALAAQKVAEKPWVQGGIDLSQQDSGLHIEKDAHGGVKVHVDPAMIARIEREGLSEIVPVIINMQPADIKALFGNNV